MPRPPPRSLTPLITAIVALGPLTLSIYGPSMPTIAAALHTSAGMVQATVGVYLLGFALGQLAYGPLSDRFGRRPLLLAGLAVYVVGSVACVLAQSIGVLIAGRLVQAVGACAGPALGRAMVRDTYAREQTARVLSLIGMALAVAPAVGPLLGGYLEIVAGWHAAFAVLAVCGAVLLALAVVLLPETNDNRDPHGLNPAAIAGHYAGLLRSRVYLGYLAVAALSVGGVYSYHAAGPFLFITLIGVSPEHYGWVNLVNVLGYLLGSFIANRLIGRVEIDRVITVSAGLMLAGGLLLPVLTLTTAPSVPTVLGPVVLWTLGMGVALPNAMAGALAPFPRIAGTASALMGFVQMAAGALGAAAVARFGDGTPLPLAVVLGGFGLIQTALFHRLIWRCRAVPGKAGL